MDTECTEIPKSNILMNVAGAAAGAVVAYFVNKWLISMTQLQTPIYTSGTFSITYALIASYGISVALLIFGARFSKMKILQWVGLGWLVSNIAQTVTLLGASMAQTQT